MARESRKIAVRDKAILAGLFLSKYDAAGLERLGYSGFQEAYNVIGIAIGSPPGSIKNYRDEFDPYFPNDRKGWHKRPLRDHCRAVREEYDELDLESFATFLNSLCGLEGPLAREIADDQPGWEYTSRLITGIAAEK